MNNTNKNIIIILLAILCVGSIGYIGYDKLNNSNNKEDDNVTENENEENSNNSTTDIKATTFANLQDLLSENDKNKLNDDYKYENVDISIGDLNFTFNCVGYGGYVGDYCSVTEILLNNNLVHRYGSATGNIDGNPYLIITDKYLIIQKKDSHRIDIYDKNGIQLTSIKNVVSSYQKENERIYTDSYIYLKDGKLYFLSWQNNNDKDFSFYNYNKINSNYLELTDSTFKIFDNQESFNAKISCVEC